MSRPWDVLLLGGASGVGKSSLSYRLAQHYGAGLTEVDDFQIIVERFTSPGQYPEFHFWRLHLDEALAMDDDEQIAFFLRYAAALEDALTLVISNHLETSMPVVLEGDFILPSLALRDWYGDQPAEGRVRAIFLSEDDEAQIARNYALRDGEEQPLRAHISWRVNGWVRAEAGRLRVPIVPARPWATVLDRAIAAVDGLLGTE
jgi:2-phosphoglycerate kinase